jgi:transposase
MKVFKQSVGIDVSKDTIACCFGSCDQSQTEKYSKSTIFSNNEEGFKQLLKWVDTQSSNKEEWYVMEATGVYYESLAYWLLNHGRKVSVFLPSKVSNYTKTLELKTKTDLVDAMVLAKIGLERKLKGWSAPDPIMHKIKGLTREYREYKFKITAAKNQLHARKHAYQCSTNTLRRLKKQIRLMENQVMEIEAELRVLIMNDTLLSDKIEKLESIPGISFITIACILGETNGFALVTNAKQLVSYAGLDVMHKQSGLKTGKSRISKRGNSFIRHALYMPALCSTMHNPDLKVFYNRVNDGKPSKKIGVTAVARKLLILVYTLWKNNTEFVPNYSAQKLAI